MNLLAFTPIEQLDNWGRYLYGLYFMVSLITTIAYGDIIGKNAFEEVKILIYLGLCFRINDSINHKFSSYFGTIYGFCQI